MKNYRNYCSGDELKDLLSTIAKSGRKLSDAEKKGRSGWGQRFEILNSQVRDGEIIMAVVHNLGGLGSQTIWTIFKAEDVSSLHEAINRLWIYAGWNPLSQEEIIKTAQKVYCDFYAFPENKLRRYVEDNVIEKITLGKCKIREGDQLILTVENWEVDGRPFWDKKQIGEEFKCWGRFLMKEKDSNGLKILVGNGSGLHSGRYWIHLSKIKCARVVSSKEIRPNNVLYLP